jgi:hypothetical protein
MSWAGLDDGAADVKVWLRHQDSNLEWLIQSQLCYRYTMPQSTGDYTG